VAKKSVKFERDETLARTMSGQYYHQPQVLLDARSDAKKINNKAMIMNSWDLGPTKPIFNGKRQDEWESADADYYHSGKDVMRSRLEKEREEYQKTGVYEIDDVDPEKNTATLCDITGKCITIALTVAATAKLAGFLGGKIRNRKTRNRKTRNRKTRHHRKK
jgi:hypothetical protein